jgi:signal transduction histidine kinase
VARRKTPELPAPVLLSAASEDPGQRVLRDKYQQLARKYAALVERLEHATDSRSAVHLLGWWGLQASEGGLALVRDGKIDLSNARWAELDALGSWLLLPRDGDVVRGYATLSELAVGEAARVSGRDHALEVRAVQMDEQRRPLVVVLAQDVTDRVRSEKELARTREALFQKEHLRVLGELASAVAHDLGSTVRSMEMRLIALERSAPGLPPLQLQAVRGLRESVTAANASVRTLTEVARSGRLIIGPIDLEHVVEQALAVLRMELRHEGHPMRVETSLKGLPPVRGTVPELTHLFISLLRNARDAMPDGGLVRVSARHLGEKVRVTVEDEGAGFAPEVEARLFEPFFSTKGTKGTGLGLWLASTTVHRVGGKIRAGNRPDARGAVLTLELPVAKG